VQTLKAKYRRGEISKEAVSIGLKHHGYTNEMLMQFFRPRQPRSMARYGLSERATSHLAAGAPTRATAG
jgi:hypothetical protein